MGTDMPSKCVCCYLTGGLLSGFLGGSRGACASCLEGSGTGMRFSSLPPGRQSRGVAGERLAQVLVVRFQQQNEPDAGQVQSQSQEF